MEDFIANIYDYSFIISNLKEFVSLIDKGYISQARRLYNETALCLEEWLNEIAQYNIDTAISLQDIALEIKDHYEDYSLSKGIIEGKLIPLLYSDISRLNSIEVSENQYTLKSTDTGYLTIRDEENGFYFHNTHDPMHEAYKMVNSLYMPEMEGYIILGSGLGYEAYQIYHQSDGAIKIYLYEDDKTILNYAIHYGVLSLIPDENIEVIHIPDREKIAELFINAINMNPTFGYHVAGFKKSAYNGVCKNELNRIIINSEHLLESSHLFTLNLWKNRMLKGINFSNLVQTNKFDEFIVISAGPSLNDSIDFLKKHKGNKGLIAVNTVLRRLIKEDILPDIVVAADPSPSLFKHIEGLEALTKDITLIADWVLSWKYAYAFHGKECFVRTNASAALTMDKLANDPIWDISGTVSCLAIEAAVKLGAKKIYLVGQDLAYPSGQKYAKGMPHEESPNAKWDMQVLSVDGSMVETCEAFEWFRRAIECQIAKYEYVEFINVSEHGAYIKGTSRYVYTQ